MLPILFGHEALGEGIIRLRELKTGRMNRNASVILDQLIEI
jgi:hypothetical protein